MHDIKHHFRIATIFILAGMFMACSDSSPQVEKLSENDIILAFGNSLTYGTGANKNESYPVILQQITGLKTINEGNPGELTEKGLQRFQKTLEKTSPKLVILCHGGNDILRKKDLSIAKQNIKSMIQLATDRNIVVMLLGVPRPGLFLNSAGIYNEIAEETGVFYMPDLIPDVLSKSELKSDTVHPNSEGYRIMAEKIEQEFRKIGLI